MPYGHAPNCWCQECFDAECARSDRALRWTLRCGFGLLAVLVLATLLAGCVYGPSRPNPPESPSNRPPTGQALHVQVSDADGPPIAGAVVTILDNQNAGRTGTTDARGQVFLEQLTTPSEFTLAATADGYVTGTVPVRLVSPTGGATSGNVTIQLAKAPPPTPPRPKVLDGRLVVRGRQMTYPDGRVFVWRGATGFQLLDHLADGRDAEARAFLQWARDTGFTVVRVLVMARHMFSLSPSEGRQALPRLFELAKEYDVYLELVALADSGSYFQTDADAALRDPAKDRAVSNRHDGLNADPIGAADSPETLSSGGHSASNLSDLLGGQFLRADLAPVVKTDVLRLTSQNLKVFRPVVTPVVVDVMNHLAGQERPPQLLFGNESAPSNVTAPGHRMVGKAQEDVALRVDVLAALPLGMQRAGWLATGRELLPAVRPVGSALGRRAAAASARSARGVQGSEASRIRAHVREVARLCATYEGCLLQIANEFYHSTQHSLVRDEIFLSSLSGEIPPEVLYTTSPSLNDEALTPTGEYVTRHRDRGRDEWNQVRRIREFEMVSAQTRRFTVDDEPIGADEQDRAGARESNPAIFFTQGALARLFMVGSTFHFQDGLFAKVPRPNQQACAEAFIAGTRIVPDDVALTYKNLGFHDGPIASAKDGTFVRLYSGLGRISITVGLGLTGADPEIRWQNGWRPVAVLAERPGVTVWEIRQ